VELESRFLGEKKLKKKRDYIEPRTKGEEANQNLTTNSSLGYLEQGLIFRTETKTKPGSSSYSRTLNPTLVVRVNPNSPEIKIRSRNVF
jgi:hypothetical protein